MPLTCMICVSSPHVYKTHCLTCCARLVDSARPCKRQANTMLSFIKRESERPRGSRNPPIPPRDIVLDALKNAGTDIEKIQGLKHE